MKKAIAVRGVLDLGAYLKGPEAQKAFSMLPRELFEPKQASKLMGVLRLLFSSCYTRVSIRQAAGSSWCTGRAAGTKRGR